MTLELPPTPWYKHGFIIFIILLTLFGFSSVSLMAYFALQNPMALVTEDYYKQGVTINQDITKYEHAIKEGITATVHFEPSNSDPKKTSVLITLNKGTLKEYPILNFAIQHRTLSNNLDQLKVINPNGLNLYKTDIDTPMSGPWVIEVVPFEKTWKLRQKIDLPLTDQIVMTGKLDY